MTQPFRPHGELEIELHGRLLVVHRAGPFNLEFTKAYTERTAELVTQLDRSGPYAILVIYHRSMLSTPEAIEYVMHRARSVDARRLHCVGQAVVADLQVEGRSIALPAVERYFRERGLRADTGRIFEAVEPARLFLEGLLNDATQQTGS